MNKLKLKTLYNQFAKGYHDYVDDPSNFWNKWLEYPHTIRLLNNQAFKGKVVLDLGCGSGRYTKELVRLGAKVSGIDKSDKLIKIAESQLPDVEFNVGSVENLPYQGSSFDYVFSGLVIDYFPNLNETFAEVSRVLKDNGSFLFSGHIPYTFLTTKVKGTDPQTFLLGNYFNEGKFEREWASLNLKQIQYHHTFQTLVSALTQNNLYIVEYLDMKPDPESEKSGLKDYYEAFIKPKFYLIKAKKTKL